ncbi:RhuM family protein [Novilysobacter longmucuonensis]|uniref:RhuM family protein n=1 Tax=Novilysobacter longmucuonensis TaxID=3098603 RepID=UPI003F8839E6
MQNKLHYAIHGHTAAELIVQRADSRKPHMGLTSWERAPDGKALNCAGTWQFPGAVVRIGYKAGAHPLQHRS